MKIAVLIHGCHRDIAGWEDVIWGAPLEGKLGRVPKGILEALERDASVVIFGSGLHYEGGTIESRYIFDYALSHLEELAPSAGMATESLRAWLEARVHFDETSSNTEEESRYALSITIEKGADRFIFVSSPWHIMRCVKNTLLESSSESRFLELRRRLYPVISDNDAPGVSVKDVVIFEPPHRPDRPNVFFNKTLKGLMPFLRTEKSDVAEGLNAALAELITAWQAKL